MAIDSNLSFVKLNELHTQMYDVANQECNIKYICFNLQKLCKIKLMITSYGQYILSTVNIVLILI